VQFGHFHCRSGEFTTDHGPRVQIVVPAGFAQAVQVDPARAVAREDKAAPPLEQAPETKDEADCALLSHFTFLATSAIDQIEAGVQQ
jgi:hypothetical protein